jgi:hypothetical protein
LTGLPFTIREILAISTLYNLRAPRQRSHFKSFQTHNMGHPGNEQPPNHASLQGALATRQSILFSVRLPGFARNDGS